MGECVVAGLTCGNTGLGHVGEPAVVLALAIDPVPSRSGLRWAAAGGADRNVVRRVETRGE